MTFATLAGGCFWCMVPPFENLRGIKNIVSGYANSNIKSPTYKDVSAGDTGAFEAIQIEFNEDIISFKEILDIFWRQIDPTDSNGQFADRGNEYQTAVFYHDENQKKIAIVSKKEIQKEFELPIATKILKMKSFYPAEEYHQEYHKKNPFHYNMYKLASGRAGFLREKWKE